MNALTRFDTQALNRALVGFDQMFDTFESRFASQLNTNYPPYNVIKVDEDNFVVELAVAGFAKTDIDISTADGKLTVKGELSTEDNDSKFIHRGIAARKFTREWALGEYMEVKAAELKDGMLKIDIIRILPEEKKPKTIKIK
jgi:molecular chaperone IbpA